MESLSEERRIGTALWEELRGMLLFSSLSHALLLGLLGLFLYHYSWVKLQRNPDKYPVYWVNLVNFLESPLKGQPKPLPHLSGLKEERRETGLLPFLKPIFKPTTFRKAKDLAVIPEEPVNPPALSKKVAYPTRLKPDQAVRRGNDTITGQLLYPPSPKKTIARRAMTELNPGRKQPTPPTLSTGIGLIPSVRIESLRKATLAQDRRYMDIPESLQVKSYQGKGMSKGGLQQLAGLLIAENLGGPAEISPPVVPPAPDPGPFSRGREGIDPSLIKGGFTSLNTQDPALIPYISQIKERLLSFWRYPMEAKPGLRGTVQLAFTVERDGSVSRIELLKTSGDPVLDKGAMQALSRASPFSPLPQEVKVTNLAIAGTFGYNME